MGERKSVQKVMFSSKIHHTTSFLQHLISVAQRYRLSAMKKIRLSTDDSETSWGVNIWKDLGGRVQYSPASEFDGPEITDEFLSIFEMKKELSRRGASFDNKKEKVYNKKPRMMRKK